MDMSGYLTDAGTDSPAALALSSASFGGPLMAGAALAFGAGAGTGAAVGAAGTGTVTCAIVTG